MYRKLFISALYVLTIIVMRVSLAFGTSRNVPVRNALHTRRNSAVIENDHGIELGAFVRRLMVPRGQRTSWVLHRMSDISWGKIVHPAPGEFRRRGKLAINVRGVSPVRVRGDAIEPLMWSIVLRGKSGNVEVPTSIDISEGNCFGSDYEHCTFRVMPSLIEAHIKAEILCTSPDFKWGNGVKMLRLFGKGLRPVDLFYFVSSGSGGSVNWLQLYWCCDVAAFAQACE